MTTAQLRALMNQLGGTTPWDPPTYFGPTRELVPAKAMAAPVAVPLSELMSDVAAVNSERIKLFL